MPSSHQARLKQRPKQRSKYSLAHPSKPNDAMIIAAFLAGLLGGLMMLSLLQPSIAKAQTLLDDCGSPINISLLQWPQTDFTRCTVSLEEILSGGIGRDGIPAIDDVTIIPVAQETTLATTEPVISLVINGEARAWP